MPYQSFLIADFNVAKSIDKEPWLTTKSAFPTIENMNINKGVLEKRKGFSLFARMKHGAVAKTDTNIVGIHKYEKNGMPDLLIMDGKRCNFYNPVDQTMTDISSDLTTPVDIFSGSQSDFFKFVNWRGVGYMVNNVDQIHKYEGRGNAVVPHDIQINSIDQKANHVDTCQYIFIIDDRMVLLGTTEFGTYHGQRLRFGAVLQTDFKIVGGGTDDAETQEVITAAGMIGKTVFAFFRGADGGSLWKIRRTGNTDIPLEWERVTRTEGSNSPHSAIEFNNGLAAVGLSNILFTEGTALRPIKFLELPHGRDILAEFNNDLIGRVFGFKQREREQRHLLFTFADLSSSSVESP